MTRAKRVLSICEESDKFTFGGARTVGSGCPICKGKKLVDCKLCDQFLIDYCTLCKGTGKIKCTMCKPDKEEQIHSNWPKNQESDVLFNPKENGLDKKDKK